MIRERYDVDKREKCDCVIYSLAQLTGGESEGEINDAITLFPRDNVSKELDELVGLRRF